MISGMPGGAEDQVDLDLVEVQKREQDARRISAPSRMNALLACGGASGGRSAIAWILVIRFHKGRKWSASRIWGRLARGQDPHVDLRRPLAGARTNARAGSAIARIESGEASSRRSVPQWIGIATRGFKSASDSAARTGSRWPEPSLAPQPQIGTRATSRPRCAEVAHAGEEVGVPREVHALGSLDRVADRGRTTVADAAGPVIGVGRLDREPAHGKLVAFGHLLHASDPGTREEAARATGDYHG